MSPTSYCPGIVSFSKESVLLEVIDWPNPWLMFRNETAKITNIGFRQDLLNKVFINFNFQSFFKDSLRFWLALPNS